ncbi:hypothetical protein FCV25MIE_13094 [Fagus crenata]
MDFTQIKENLPNPFGDDSATAVNAEQILPTNPAASILSTDPSTAVNVEQILSTNSAASMQYSDPNIAVNVEKTLPKKSTASIPSFDPSIAANHVEKDVHSCAKSPPDDSATAVNMEQILPTNPAASILSIDPSTAVNVEQILSTNSAASMQYSDQNTAVNVEKTLPKKSTNSAASMQYSDQNTAKTLPKKSTASIPSFVPSIAANRVEKDVHSSAKSPPDFLQQNAVHSCVKSSPHFPQKNDVGKKGDKINWSGILRDISGSIRKGKESQLRKKKSMGGPKTLPSGKENILKNTCGVQSSPNGQEKNSTNMCDLSGLHEVKIQTEPSGLHEVKIQTEPRGSWKRVLRDKNLSQESVECSQFFEGNQIQKISGVKRSGALSDGDSNYSGWQKKVRGNEGNQSTTSDGDEAETVIMYPFSFIWTPALDIVNQKEDLVNLKRSGLSILNVKLLYRMCGLVRKQLEALCLSSVRKSSIVEKLYIDGTRMFQANSKIR